MRIIFSIGTVGSQAAVVFALRHRHVVDDEEHALVEGGMSGYFCHRVIDRYELGLGNNVPRRVDGDSIHDGIYFWGDHDLGET